MANIQERRNKDGKLISYSIRVHRGRGADGKQLKPYTATFDVLPTWKEETARKKAEAFASVFEKECRDGIKADGAVAKRLTQSSCPQLRFYAQKCQEAEKSTPKGCKKQRVYRPCKKIFRFKRL